MIVNRWDDAGAARSTGGLGERVYTSRLLGVDPDLVLHGGGNTSVKLRHTNVFGEEVDALVVKGSGSDLAEIDESGFAWLRLDAVARLAQLDELSDTQMAEELRLAEVVAGGPAPSVEAILHALIPARFVDHTHADAVVTITNTPAGAAGVREVYGNRVLVVPYVMPGFKLAKLFGEMLAVGRRRRRRSSHEPRHLHVGRDGEGLLRPDDRAGAAGRSVRGRPPAALAGGTAGAGAGAGPPRPRPPPA